MAARMAAPLTGLWRNRARTWDWRLKPVGVEHVLAVINRPED